MAHILAVLVLITAFCHGQFTAAAGSSEYKWSIVTPAASYPQAYNYPVFVFGDWMVAMNNGAWVSRDGRRWRRTSLPEIGLNSAYQRYVQFNGAVYALGAMTGNYESFRITPVIRRTRDLETWEVLAVDSNIPRRVFYGAAVFRGRMWIIGGYDGRSYHNDVWSSADGVHWLREVENAPFSKRNSGVVTVFRDKLWMFGGGVIDGEGRDWNPNSYKEAWVSDDGRTWNLAETNLNRKWGGTPVVFDGRLWLLGLNRGSAFASAVWHTDDGLSWKEETAPWSPRGAVAGWVHERKLFVTGGKSSHTENGQIRFVYSNDVWSMERKEAK